MCIIGDVHIDVQNNLDSREHKYYCMVHHSVWERGEGFRP